MLRKFFIWRAEKRMGRSRYRMDRRAYKGIFSAGFFAHLSRSKFWQTDNDPYFRARRRKKRMLLFLMILMAVAGVWIVVESSRAMQVF